MLCKANAKDPSNYEEREIEKKTNKLLLTFQFLKKQSDRLWLKLLQKNEQKKRKHLENKLNENTEMMKKLKKKL